MKKIFIFGLLVFLSQSIFSKEVTKPNLNRRINDNIINLIQKYESTCTFSDSKSELSFYSLFTDLALIYNDYLPYNNRQEVTPGQYFKIIQNKETKTDFTVAFSEMQFMDTLKFLANNIYISKVRLNKKMIFTNWNGFVYPEKNFELIIDVLVNTDNPEKIDCRINKITAVNPVMDFSILNMNLKNSGPDIEKLFVEGEPLVTEKNDKKPVVFLPGIANPQEVITIDSYDGFLNFKTDNSANPDKSIYYLNILNYKSDVGFTFQYNSLPGYSFTSPNEISSSLQNIKTTNTGYSLGIDFNKKIVRSGRMYYFLNLGVGYEQNNIKFSGDYSNEGHEYEAADSDGDNYLRRVELKGINENIDLKFLYLPVGFKMNYYLFNRLSIESTIGAKIFYLFDKSTTSSVAQANYKGYYDQYDQVLLDRYYDFGTFSIPSQTKALELPVLNYGAFANIGANYKLNQRLFASLKVGYYYAVSNMANKKDNFVLSNTKDDYNSLIYAYNFIRKNNLTISFGLNYKF
ncbi:MAG TPA: hypothetical protein P5084_07790 [Paludibacter sp.]|nr:hypothetical protein [Paludibacter sp.]